MPIESTAKSSTSTPKPTTSLSPKQQVLAECLVLVGRPLRRTTAVALPLAVIAAFALRHDVDPTMLGLWLGLVAGATVILTYVAGFAPPLDTVESIENRHNEVVFTVGLLGAAWGTGPLIAFPADTTMRMLLGATLLAVVSSVGLGTLLLRRAFFALALPLLGPLFIRLGTSGGSSEFAAAIVLAVCCVSLILHFLEGNTSSVTLVRNRIENSLLGQRVERLKGRIVANEEELEVAYRLLDEYRSGAGVPATIVERASVLSRTEFNMRLGDIWAATTPDTDSFSVALVEIADFNQIVNEYGDDVAKRLFNELGRFIGSCLRTEDCVAGFTAPRYGLLLCDSDSETASRALERIRRRVETSPMDVGQPILCQLVMGVVSFEFNIRPVEMIGRSERALAQAWTLTQRIQAWEHINGSPIASLRQTNDPMQPGTQRFILSDTTLRETPAAPRPR